MKRQTNHWGTNVSSTTEGMGATFLPLLTLAGLIGVIVMAARRIKKVAAKAVDMSPFVKSPGLVGWKIGEKKPRPNVFKILIKQWQFWVLLIVFLSVIVLSIVSSSDDVEVVNGQATQPVVETQHAEQNHQSNATTGYVSEFQQMVNDTLGTTASSIVSWMDLIILLIVLGFIVGVFIKLGGLFKDL